ncbi:ubiquinol-cytochrome C chaperone [Sporothrix brasiliensis 5110]|uniref:Ubiquinol-cytochrome C chaperone n=1 Tax=Sporothrix brasiliensis 5110 TaxID=1398154 RepID=A0A0C2FPL1_9PEZI|nr:ubiquinol-cytochrome C chaperone [Sporothrix brasiliensis 5110]KIH93003.1 ubiquinol-cytochrome C chaperone [Sporothrix brasiliensis 5110]
MARSAISRTAEPYGAFGVTRAIYQKCTRPAAYDISEETRRNDQVPTTEDGEELGVGGGVTMLHMYLVITRLRCFDKEAHQLWQSMLSDHFFQEAEDKMDRLHHITSRGLRQRHLQDLFMAWRGVIVAYDEGVVRGDAVLAAAVWRNLFKAHPDVDLRHLASVVAWMRRSLAQLDRMQDEGLILHAGAGIFGWAPPTMDLAAVDEPATKELGLLMQQAARKEETSTDGSAKVVASA